MPASGFAAKVRVDAVDFDADRRGQATEQLSFGLNFRPTVESALKLDVVRGRSRDEFNVRSDHVRLLMSLATYF
jgi:hypothetical protein